MQKKYVCFTLHRDYFNNYLFSICLLWHIKMMEKLVKNSTMLFIRIQPIIFDKYNDARSVMTCKPSPST